MGGGQPVALRHMAGFEPYQYWMFGLGALLVMGLILRQVSVDKHIKKRFRNVFPSQMRNMRIE